jgi:ECF transporter S component (folate family)
MVKKYFRRLTVKDTAIVGLLTALVIVFTIASNYTTSETFRPVYLVFIPAVVLCGLYGPFYGGVMLAISDIIGYLTYPGGGGPFFPGYTLTALLTGIVFGLFLYTDKLTILRIVLAAAIVCFVFNVGLNSLWLYILYGKGTLVTLPYRLIAQGAIFIVQILISKKLIEFSKKLIHSS